MPNTLRDAYALALRLTLGTLRFHALNLWKRNWLRRTVIGALTFTVLVLWPSAFGGALLMLAPVWVGCKGYLAVARLKRWARRKSVMRVTIRFS